MSSLTGDIVDPLRDIGRVKVLFFDQFIAENRDGFEFFVLNSEELLERRVILYQVLNSLRNGNEK